MANFTIKYNINLDADSHNLKTIVEVKDRVDLMEAELYAISFCREKLANGHWINKELFRVRSINYTVNKTPGNS